MEFKDYYQVLGVSEDASADDIKRAYRKMARKYHPDVSREADAEVRFKGVNEAYEALKDPEKRQAYDDIRRSPYRHGARFEPPPGWNHGADSRDGFTDVDASAFSDFFRTLFGDFGDDLNFGSRTSSRRTRFSQRGEDIHDRLQITLREAYAGANRQLTLSSPDARRRARTLNVRIPAGATQGRRVRLRGQGAPGIDDAPAGDLYLEIAVVPHPVFGLDGRDITLTLPVAPWEAALGANVATPTLGGPVELKIPPGSRAGTKLRMRGRGLPGKPPGDQIVTLEIALPPAATKEQTALYQRMADSFDFDPRADLRA